MPTVPLHLGPKEPISQSPNPLPQLLQTPAGLAILEIQGTINLPQASSSEPTTKVGRLVFPDYSSENPTQSVVWMKRVYLYVGQHQRLTGEVKNLPKPLAVIRKRATSDSANEELQKMDIVYWKVIFSSRPEPVGTN